MRFHMISLAALPLASTALAQSLAPSPTESIGCEPHGDHWHCAGPRVTGSGTATAASAATTSAHHDHDDDDDDDDHGHSATGSVSLKPSPTESIGCEPHGDHWHCSGPRVTTITATGSNGTAVGAMPVIITSTATRNANLTDAAFTGTGSIKPSPTESVGCEPHGDHWHCSGPRVTSTAPISATARSASVSISRISTAGATVVTGVNGLMAAGGMLAAVGLGL